MTQHTPLTEQQLHEIGIRLNAATPGPWGVYEYGGGSKLDIAADLEETGCGYRARREICSLEDEPLDNDPTHREWTAEEDWAQVQADAAFIAHAPEDVRALLAEVRRLKGQRKFLLGAMARKDAASGAADAAVSAFLAGKAPEPQEEPESPSAALLRAEAWRELADRADPAKPEVSWFGDFGHQVGEWIRQQAEHEERAADATGRDCPGFEKQFQTESDAKRRFPNCKHCGKPRAAHPAAAAASGGGR